MFKDNIDLVMDDVVFDHHIQRLWKTNRKLAAQSLDITDNLSKHVHRKYHGEVCPECRERPVQWRGLCSRCQIRKYAKMKRHFQRHLQVA